MNKVKYVLSGAVIALLTAVFMLLPNIYNNYNRADSAQARVAAVSLEHNERKLTQSETIRIFINNIENCIYRSAKNEQTEIAYIADCGQIVREVFGDEKESEISKNIIETINNSENPNIKTQKVTAIDNDNIVVLTIDYVYFDGFELVYEQESKVMLYMYFGSSDPVETDIYASEYSPENEATKALESYYYSLGLDDFEFYCSDQSSDIYADVLNQRRL